MSTTTSQQSISKVYYGAIIQSRSLTELDAWPRALLAIDASGVIAWIETDVSSSEVRDVAGRHGWDIGDSSTVEFIEGKKGEWIMPGLVDTHTVRVRLGECVGFGSDRLHFSMRRNSLILGREFLDFLV